MNKNKVKVEICSLLKLLYEKGLISSVGGNISARSPNASSFWITPSGLFKGGLKPSDLVEIDLNGNIIEGKELPSSELPTHLNIYRNREDINVVIHAHPPITVALATAKIKFNPMTPENVVYSGRISVIDFVTPGEESGKVVGEEAKRSDFIIVRNHGVFSLGKSFHDALARIEVVEENSKMILIGSIVKNISPLTQNTVAVLKETYKR